MENTKRAKVSAAQGAIKIICAGPGTRADSAMDQLEKLVKELADLHGPHMNLEKGHIFGSLRQQFNAAELSEMQAEMKNRFEGKRK